MTRLYLVRRWGPNEAGHTITVDDPVQARWLLDHSFAQTSKDSGSVTSGAAAPGTSGPDPRAGGDGTRLRPTSIRSVDTRDNRALPVAGSPVQYNAGVAPSTSGSRPRTGADSESPNPDGPGASAGRRRTKTS